MFIVRQVNQLKSCGHNLPTMVLVDGAGELVGCPCLPLSFDDGTGIVRGMPCQAMIQNGGICPRLPRESELARLVVSH